MRNRRSVRTSWSGTRRRNFPLNLLPKLAALGLVGIQFPEEYGGAALSAVDYCICIEELARVCPAVALSVAAHNGLCSAHIFAFGNDEQKKQFLPRLVHGEVWGAWGLTEAGAGSDAAGMRTTAVRQGDCWVINGAKTFITHGKIGGVMVVIAVTDRTKGHRGISAFIVEHGTPGMSAGKKENKLGMRASDTSEVIFDDCRVPVGQLLGEEGQGFINTLQVLDGGRIGIAALSVGLAQGAYEAARQLREGAPPVRSADRRVPGHSMEARRQCDADRGRAPPHVSRRISARPRCAHDDAESSTAKLFASEVAVRAADDCVQIHGGYGFVKDYPAEKYFRDVKLLTIGEGTSEIQRLVIARQLLS